MDPQYQSYRNQGVEPAKPEEFSPFFIGPIQVWPPVVLAPMAGVTNLAYRRICRNFGAALYVSEMITARPLVMGNAKTLKLAQFAPDESPRSLQLYGVDPYYVSEAVKRLVSDHQIDHLDMNFGCSVPKVTRKGGGAALPYKRRLLAAIIAAAVKAAGKIPVTIKFRIGIDDETHTFLDTGRIAREEGCAAIALHARTAQQFYEGQAQWERIAELKDAVSGIPVLGNGDIWEAEDALRMMRSTGCDGVVIGRGCLGRPWLFRELSAVFSGQPAPNPPTLGEIATMMAEHAQALWDYYGPDSEAMAMRAFRKHSTWYTKGFSGGAQLRSSLMQVSNFQDLLDILGSFPKDEPYPPAAMRSVRGKSGRRQAKVTLPDGYLRDPDEMPKLLAEESIDGG